MALLLFTYCKEEPVQPKEVTNTAEMSAAKVASDAQLAVLLDDDKTTKKEKIEKLKAEHEKPYAARKKPIDALKEYLAARKAGKTSGSSKSVNQKTVMQQICNPIYVDVWAFEKYEPSAGAIGILTPESWQSDATVLNELRNKYGFRQIIMVETAIQQNTSSFQNSEMYVCLTELDLGLALVNNNPIPGKPLNWCAGLYIEEPFSHENNPDYIQDSKNQTWAVRHAWKNKYGQSSPVLLGETTTEILSELAECADYVNSTSYWDYFYPGPPSLNLMLKVYTNDDQRDVWTDNYNSFGSKFNYVWISAHADRYEYNQLLTHAIDRGISNIWLYNPWGDWSHISEFCYSAKNKGMLNSFSRKFLYEYTYIGTGNPCTDDDETHWLFTDIISTQIVEQD